MSLMMRAIVLDSRSARRWVPALVATLALTAPAGADVKVQQKTVSEGLSGFGNSSSTSTLWIAGDKSRSEEDYTYTGRFKTFAGGGKPQQSVTITRVDRELIWTLDPKQKQYTELTFAEMRKRFEEGMKQLEEQPAPEEQPKASDYEFKLESRKTGAKETINGFACEQVIVTATGKPKDPEPGQENARLVMTMDVWQTKQVPGEAETREFHRRMAQKLGLDEALRQMVPQAQALYGGTMKEMASKLEGLDGYTVRNTFTVEGPPPAPEDEKKKADAKKQAEASKQAADQSDQAEDVSDAAQLGTALGSGDKSSAGGIVGGFLGRKAAKRATDKITQGAGASDGKPAGPLLKVVTETVAIVTEPAPAGAFDVPGGYKLKKQDEGR